MYGLSRLATLLVAGDFGDTHKNPPPRQLLRGYGADKPITGSGPGPEPTPVKIELVLTHHETTPAAA